MAGKKYLDLEGLSQVADQVNTRLKTVTAMPASANNGAVRLYVGNTEAGFTKGHIYQYDSTQNKWVDITGSGGGGGGGTAATTSYDNTDSGLQATNVQDAIDEVLEAAKNASTTAAGAVGLAQSAKDYTDQQIAQAITQVLNTNF